jgi:hypothetical protein
MNTIATVDEPGWRRAIDEVCAELGWQLRVDHAEGTTLVICPLPNEANMKGVLFVIAPVARRLTVYVTYRAEVPPPRREAMLTASALINAGLLSGCFEFDREGGEARYRDAILLIDGGVDTKLLQALVATTLQDALSCQVALDAVIAGATPEKAVETLV